jgi:hypothetical protein
MNIPHLAEHVDQAAKKQHADSTHQAGLVQKAPDQQLAPMKFDSMVTDISWWEPAAPA